jgi:IS1 family transposase
MCKAELGRLWTFVKKKHIPKMGCKPEEERWVWLSFDPKNKIILAAHLGDMTQKSSDEIVKQIHQKS